MMRVKRNFFSGVLFLATALVVGALFSHQALASSASSSFMTVTAVSGTYGGTVTITARLHVGTTSAPIVGRSVTFTLAGQSLGKLATTTDSNGMAIWSNVNIYGIDAGSYASGFTAKFAGDTHYNALSSSTSLTISQAPLTVTGVTASNKVYDQTLTATINAKNAALVGIINSENMTLATSSATGAFLTKTVGTGKTVNISSLSLGGTATSSNYSLTQPTATANINAKSLTVSGITAVNKNYDGTTAATLGGHNTGLVGLIGGDTVTFSTSSMAGTFSDKNIGTGKTVTIAGITLGGADGGNYSIPVNPTAAANINTRPITVTAAANSKTYDSSMTAAAVPTVTSGTLAAGDTGTFTETYDNKTIGSSHVVTPAGTIADGSAVNMTANYAITFATLSSGVINSKALVGSITANNKFFDGTTAATIASRSLNGVIGSDDVSYTGGSASFSDSAVGTGKLVSATGLSLSGNDAGNYTVNSTATTTANINANTGGGGSLGISYCSSVVYGDWKACSGGWQYRDVISQSPSSCTLSSAQQSARSMACGTTPANAVTPTTPNSPNSPAVSPAAPIYSPTVPAAVKAKIISITATILNVRSLGSAKGKIIAKFKKGQKYTVLASNKGWYKIQVKKGVTGWISAAWTK
jgi:trimeric autotransporter adhesin